MSSSWQKDYFPEKNDNRLELVELELKRVTPLEKEKILFQTFYVLTKVPC